MKIKILMLALFLLFSPASASASTLSTEATTTEVATSQPGEPATEEEPVFLEKDEGLLRFQYIDETYTVVTNRDIYVLLVRIYNLLLFFLWTVIVMFVINRVFEAFKPAYKVSKE